MVDLSSNFSHFRLIAEGIDVGPIMSELRLNRTLWYVDQRRQARVRVQSQTNSIGLRRGVPSGDRSVRLEDVQAVADTDHRPKFPRTMAILSSIAEAEQGELARAMLVRLKPQGKVHGHVDEGSYYARRDRYHLVLHSPDGSDMRCGDERALFRVGQLWCFDNKGFHEAFNHSDDWRTHLIFDLLPVGRPLHFTNHLRMAEA
ncbi:aspartyl/asparaginyl beta-hydroxylase domain-containing protein [Azospirillum sp. A26]|uniref:aspartyl/asparaginyl beta-hydroxylase domain-containing protein n=1 Tax=Azospirillum sp. A26 TaxID=3160607 RepID=UPI00366C211D